MLGGVMNSWESYCESWLLRHSLESFCRSSIEVLTAFFCLFLRVDQSSEVHLIIFLTAY